ncbi:hypothetical protein PI125_g2045 [Phytophthora idaei]|nr:hypothetical protein PI125_g2045 [Phytophthora idaei]
MRCPRWDIDSQGSQEVQAGKGVSPAQSARVCFCRLPKATYTNSGADAGLLEAIFYRSAHGLSINTSMFRDLVHQAALATCIKKVPNSFPNLK